MTSPISPIDTQALRTLLAAATPELLRVRVAGLRRFAANALADAIRALAKGGAK